MDERVFFFPVVLGSSSGYGYPNQLKNLAQARFFALLSSTCPPDLKI
jgi:hypothetical protein